MINTHKPGAGIKNMLSRVSVFIFIRIKTVEKNNFLEFRN